MKKIKIGIICTRASSEKKKDELLNCNSNLRPWLKDTPKQFCIYRTRRGIRQCCVPADVSVGMYIKYTYDNVDVDIIPYKDISCKRLKQNTINFMLIYDLLEAFHNTKSKAEYNRLKDALMKSKNVYPPPQFQQFVNDKSKYIPYLNKKKVNVIPTFKRSYKQLQRVGVSKDILNEVKQKKWNTFIAKPIFGQESIGFKKFTTIKDNNDQKVIQEIKHYIKHFKTKLEKGKPEHLPGIIFQKYIEGFDKNNPEIRMYYINGKYQYSIVTTDKKVSVPKQEKGTLQVKPYKELQQFSKTVLNRLPKVLKGTGSPLLIRVDIACQKNFSKPWIVNEIEFVPSLYIEDISKIPEPNLGDTMIEITKKFVK